LPLSLFGPSLTPGAAGPLIANFHILVIAILSIHVLVYATWIQDRSKYVRAPGRISGGSAGFAAVGSVPALLKIEDFCGDQTDDC
jgi:hypothetical protein